MNPPITLAWLKMYRFLYLEQTTQEKTGHQLTKPNYSTAKKLPYSHEVVFSLFMLYMVYNIS